jgi:hypothetical protein
VEWRGVLQLGGDVSVNDVVHVALASGQWNDVVKLWPVDSVRHSGMAWCQ